MSELFGEQLLRKEFLNDPTFIYGSAGIQNATVVKGDVVHFIQKANYTDAGKRKRVEIWGL